VSEIVAYTAWLLGLPWLVRNTIARRRVSILLYHDPDPATFDAHLAYLRRHYHIVSFARMIEALESDSWASLPDRAVVVHLDDGYKGNFALSEACERHGVTPTLYLCSHVVGTQRRFWSKLKGGRSKQLRLVDNQRLLRKLREEADYTPDREFEGCEALSAEELQAMASRFDFQSHGRYHFSALTLDQDALSEELDASRERIEALTGGVCEHFSYPYGDFSKREIEAAKRAGYRSARSTQPGWVGPGADLYALPIVADVPGNASVNQLRLQLTGLPRFLKRCSYVLLTRHVYAVRQRVLMSRPFF
jgi:peptidoglycan/xylan/chitin deacetylase (PgdA/CDA1 family)